LKECALLLSQFLLAELLVFDCLKDVSIFHECLDYFETEDAQTKEFQLLDLEQFLEGNSNFLESLYERKNF